MIRELVIENQGISKLQLCRLINCEALRHCKYCSEYANPNKRRKGLSFKRMCKYSFQKIRYHITKIPDLAIVKMQRPDNFQHRGWDWMSCLFIPTYEDPDQAREGVWLRDQENWGEWNPVLVEAER